MKVKKGKKKALWVDRIIEKREAPDGSIEYKFGFWNLSNSDKDTQWSKALPRHDAFVDHFNARSENPAVSGEEKEEDSDSDEDPDLEPEVVARLENPDLEQKDFEANVMTWRGIDSSFIRQDLHWSAICADIGKRVNVRC